VERSVNRLNIEISLENQIVVESKLFKQYADDSIDIAVQWKDPKQLVLDDSTLSKHVLFLGGIGTGKTNAIFQFVEKIRNNADPRNDVLIVFDTKGDYLRFYKDGDLVLSNREDEGRKRNKEFNYVRWNLLREIECDEEEYKEQTANEIARTLYEPYSKNVENPFFPNSARQITQAVLMALASGGNAGRFSNVDIRTILTSPESISIEKTVGDIQESLATRPSSNWVLRYIDPSAPPQAGGVLGEVSIMLGDLFSGFFGTKGDFSIREFVRRSGRGRALFIEYDIGAGSALTPVYRVLIDLAIKETLSRSKGSGNVYFILDEFGRLPNLNLIEAGVNYGRELGARFLAGTQTIGQILSGYGEGTGNSVLSGFGTLFAFNLFDQASRNFVSERYGSMRKKISFRPSVATEGTHDQLTDGKVIEDWYISDLQVGEAIAILPNDHRPRKVKFALYG
jgi:hypothetical protein